MVHTADQRLIAYDAAMLPELVTAWEFAPGAAFADWALVDTQLYLSRWFEGLWRYAIGPAGTAALLDTSMVGIMVTQMEAEGPWLYVLDEYNGIMRYDPAGAGSAAFLDYLYVPQEVLSFAQADSTSAMIGRSGGVVIGRYPGPQSLVAPAVPDGDRPQRVYLSGDAMVTVAPRSIEVRDRGTGEVRAAMAIEGVVTDGALFTRGGTRYLVLPREAGGLFLVNIDDLGQSGPGLYRSGPVQALAFGGGKLFTSGGHNPIEAYTFDSTLAPHLDFALLPHLNSMQALTVTGDTLLAYMAGINTIVVIRRPFFADSFLVDRAKKGDDTMAGRIVFLPRLRHDSLRAIAVTGLRTMQVFTINDSGRVSSQEPWEQQFGITASCLTDTMVFLATGKDQIWSYRIGPDLRTQLAGITDLPSQASVMVWDSGRLLVFVRDQLLVSRLLPSGALSVESWIDMPFTASDAVISGRGLFAVGTTGIGVFRLDREVPELAEYGGDPGTVIAVSGEMVAASDGGSVKIYRLGVATGVDPEPELPRRFALDQNYPNPFNGETVIRYSLAEGARVRLAVYNVLGQRVKTLVDEYRAAGIYEALWDGTDRAGAPVASGVYLYRLEAGKAAGARKMVFVK